ncbi:2-nonaprenyl-3-methyl-6-methoxy-1,4-benzoquinol hydroxylase [Hibiscus syriacus]|uniref:2-nonaprenyl-3-methyl-6-methoxy-1,4-benzoquinol hydroxylase n=1 Tax=Hibiscus syriacus TaxID=106335 RepID=A0A6A2YP52_HIBSY|nr:2-nonaprenyl-3-methyl-6-methoxy-1,4-benzoquinol hydroxylase [Hibiscus syriacus]
MSSGAVAASKAWVVAATIGAVEALKDQGICRWNYTLRSLHQHAKNNLRSSSFFSSSSSSSTAVAGAVSNKLREERRWKAERNMKKVLEMNSWGPTTVRF